MNLFTMFSCSHEKTMTPLKQTHIGAEYFKSLHMIIQSLKRGPFYLTLFFICSRKQQKYVPRCARHSKGEFEKELKVSSIFRLLSNIQINLNALTLCCKVIDCMGHYMFSTMLFGIIAQYGNLEAKS